MALKRQTNFDRDQKAAAIDQKTGRDRLLELYQLFRRLCSTISYLLHNQKDFLFLL
jgi:hypothetical protein